MKRAILGAGSSSVGDEYDVIVLDAKDCVFHGDCDGVPGVGAADAQALPSDGDGPASATRRIALRRCRWWQRFSRGRRGHAQRPTGPRVWS